MDEKNKKHTRCMFILNQIEFHPHCILLCVVIAVTILGMPIVSTYIVMICYPFLELYYCYYCHSSLCRPTCMLDHIVPL